MEKSWVVWLENLIRCAGQVEVIESVEEVNAIYVSRNYREIVLLTIFTEKLKDLKQDRIINNWFQLAREI